MPKQAYLSVQPALTKDGPSFVGYPVDLPFSEKISVTHFHDQFEIGICDEGESIFFVNNEYYYVSKGDAIFIPPNIRHYSRSLDKTNPCFCQFVYMKSEKIKEIISCVSSETGIAELLLASTKISIPPIIHASDKPKAVAWLTDIIQLCKVEQPNLTALLNLRLTSFLFEEYSESLLKTNSFVHNDEEKNKVDEIIYSTAEYLSINYDRNDSVKDLAQMCHLSESQFNRRFIKVFGVSPIAYRIQIRCNVAIELLYHTDLSLQEISARVGYTNYPDFYRMFKKNKNITPAEYRKIKVQ